MLFYKVIASPQNLQNAPHTQFGNTFTFKYVYKKW